MSKDELKDEMKNKISMALKDPILQQGFEIICNENEQIEHLREERNYFQEKCEDIELNYYCDHKGGCKVQELEKENAELKAKNKWYSEQVCNKECAEVWRNLTEAKEHIKQLLDCLKQDTNDPETNYYVCQYMDKAEQFLKGENIILEDAQAGNSPFDADEVFNKEMKAYTEEK